MELLYSSMTCQKAVECAKEVRCDVFWLTVEVEEQVLQLWSTREKDNAFSTGICYCIYTICNIFKFFFFSRNDFIQWLAIILYYNNHHIIISVWEYFYINSMEYFYVKMFDWKIRKYQIRKK